MRRLGLILVLVSIIPPCVPAQSPQSIPISMVQGYPSEPVAVTDAEGNTIISWVDSRAGRRQVLAQKFNPQGHALWPAGALVWDSSGAEVGEIRHGMAADGSGGAFIGVTACFKAGGTYRYEWFIQSVDSAGALKFDPRGISVGGDMANLRNTVYTYASPGVANDGSGGAYISWGQWSEESDDVDLHVQRINPAGITLWDSGGRNFPTTDREEFWTVAVSDDGGGVIVVADAWKHGKGPELLALRLDALGVPQWANDWILVDSMRRRDAILRTQFSAIKDGEGGIVIAEESAEAPGRGLRVRRLSHEGDFVWNHAVDEAPVDDIPPWPPALTRGSSGEIFVGWGKYDSGNQVNLAQRISVSGEIMWGSGGIYLGTHPFYYGSSPSLALDGYGGVIAAWSSADTIVVQQLDSNGARLLGPDGLPYPGLGELNGAVASGKGSGIIYYTRDQELFGFTFSDVPIFPGILATWRLKSVHKTVDDASLRTLFPTSAPKAYRFLLQTYLHEDTLQTGYGYWIKTPGGQDAEVVMNVVGTVLPAETVEVGAGWSTIGSVTEAFPADAITTIPPGLITSPVFDYNGGYGVADSIEPGAGYWVKLDAPGQVILAPGSGSSKPSASPASPEDAGVLTITDAAGRRQQLFFGEYSTDDLSRFDLPPPPPPGAFDVRLASGRFAGRPTREPATHPILLSGVTYPATITWIGSEPAGGVALRVSNREIALTGPVVLRQPGPIELWFGPDPTAGPPGTFGLEQNYPNPFNPVTRIRYVLAGRAHVSLTVTNLLGQTVAVLVDEVQEAGPKSIEWNAAGFANGIYFCRLVTPGFSETRKMVVLK